MVNLTQTQLSELLLVLLLPPHVDFYRLSLRRNPSSHFRHLIELVPISGRLFDCRLLGRIIRLLLLADLMSQYKSEALNEWVGGLDVSGRNCQEKFGIQGEHVDKCGNELGDIFQAFAVCLALRDELLGILLDEDILFFTWLVQEIFRNTRLSICFRHIVVF